MGYLAQRKKHLRTDFILKSLLVLLAFFSAAAFAGNAFGQFLNQWRFQFYLLVGAGAFFRRGRKGENGFRDDLSAASVVAARHF